MNNIDFEKYYRKGGEVVIPVEVFNDMIGQWEDLIKYLEDKIKDCDYQIYIIDNYQKICEKRAYKDILERVRSGKYE